MTPLTGTVVSFFSHKGGVGRTMTVVNVAMTLARNGFRVLVVDLDLLAPGVQGYPGFREAVDPMRYAPPAERDLGQGGILDLVERQIWSASKNKKGATQQRFKEDYVPAKGDHTTWQKWTREVQPDLGSGGRLHVLPAGPADHRAVDTLARVGWYRFLTEFGGLPFILSMRDRSWRTNYDFTLIDSRTGLSDYLQFCVGILPDVAVMIAGLNEQNLEGMGAAMASVEEVLPSRISDLFVIPVLSLIPSAELDHLRDRFRRAQAMLSSVQERADASTGGPTLRILGEPVKLPYVATLSVAERLVVPKYHDAPIFRPYVRIAEMLARHRFAEIDNLLDEAIYEGTSGLGSSTVIEILKHAREASSAAGYVWGSISAEKYDGQRAAYNGQVKPSLDCFKRARELMRERRGLRTDEPWEKADDAVGHWQVELEALVFYARVLALNSEHAAAVAAFTDVLEFVAQFERRNYADMFSDRDWDRYSHELLFTRASCQLGRLASQIKEVEAGGTISTPAIRANLEEVRSLLRQLMPSGIHTAMRERLEDCEIALTKL